MALAGTWLLTPSEWLVIIWLSLGFLLYSGYRKWGQSHLSRISHFTLISAVTRIAIISPNRTIIHDASASSILSKSV